MPTDLTTLIFVLVAAAFLAGLYGERWRARLARARWQARNPAKKREPRRNAPETVVPFAKPATPRDAADQLRIVMRSTFQKQRLLSKSEAQVFYAAERAIAQRKLPWRVMAQVNLGEILSTPDELAFSTINSKRVDLLVIASNGEPIAAIEYQGSGHYQGAASARDAVKKEALRRAGVRYLEVTPEHDANDLAREFDRMVRALEPALRG